MGSREFFINSYILNEDVKQSEIRAFETLDEPLFTSEGLLVSIMLVVPTLTLSLKPLIRKYIETT